MKRRLILATAIALGIGLLTVSLLVLTHPLRRRSPLRVPRPAARPAPRAPAALGTLPQDRWTTRLVELEDAAEWVQLDAELNSIRSLQPGPYTRYQLSYLHARVKQQLEDYEHAAALFKPYLEPGHPFRDLALFHMGEIAREEKRNDEAAGYRDELIFSHARSVFRSQAIEEQLAYFAASGELEVFTRFAGQLRPQADTSLRRIIDAHLIEMLAARGALAEAKERGIRLIRGESNDDGAERAFRALDRAEILRTATPEELMLLGEAVRVHRHFDRAVTLLTAARTRLPAKRDELTFAIGRSHFGNEQYEVAEKTYVEGAGSARTPEAKATFFFHASRCAQLLGDDARAESYMTRAIAVPGRFAPTSAALTQRMRTRAHGKRFQAAAGDLRLLKQLFPNNQAVVEASISLASAWIAAGQLEDALRDLNAIPRAALERYDPSEIAYWKARALEKSDADSALESYLDVLRTDVPTHFAYLARQRLGGPFKAAAVAELDRLHGEVERALGENNPERARRLQTEFVLLAPNQRRELDKLRALYRDHPRYRKILVLKPRAFPAFPLGPGASRGDLLFAMGLLDEVIDEISQRYPLQPLDSALTAAYAFHLAGASRSSLHAIETLVRNIPDDFIPELLPRLVQEMLYPRYFYGFILEDAETYDADPVLVLAIMREESRFNPRAKSVAAARGLLQLILTTALQIGRDLGITELSSADLYDPRIVIQLGAKHIGDLLDQFNGNGYHAAAAYNAGPDQARLWGRLAPAAGNDFFLSAINFDETKHYVRRVMNSYQRYGEIYGSAGAAGGMRAEP